MGQLNPTRQEILEAYEALNTLITHECLTALNTDQEDAIYEREQLIRKCLPPIPHPTMNDIEWDDDKHYLAEAEHTSLGKVVMLSKTREGGEIYYTRRGFEGKLLTLASPDSLTPTGRRYILQEEA